MKRFNKPLRALFKTVKGNNLQDFILILLGTAVQALSLRIFLIPPCWSQAGSVDYPRSSIFILTGQLG